MMEFQVLNKKISGLKNGMQAYIIKRRYEQCTAVTHILHGPLI